MFAYRNDFRIGLFILNMTLAENGLNNLITIITLFDYSYRLFAYIRNRIKTNRESRLKTKRGEEKHMQDIVLLLTYDVQNNPIQVKAELNDITPDSEIVTRKKPPRILHVHLRIGGSEQESQMPKGITS